MKKLILLLALFGMSCASQETVTEPLFPIGGTFSVPCDKHGSHLQTIVGAHPTILYQVVDESGRVVIASEEDLKQFFENTGIQVDKPEVIR